MDTTSVPNPVPTPVPNPVTVSPPPPQQPPINSVPTNPVIPVNNKFKYLLILMSITIVVLLILLAVLLFVKSTSLQSYTSPLRANSDVDDFGFLYIIPTRITALEAQGNNTFKISTTIKEKGLSTIVTSDVTRVVAMDKEKEREVPRKMLRQDMNVDLSLFYSLRVNQWRINKIRITSDPFNTLIKEIAAPSSPANNP
jgi:hypothetical protein